MARHPLVLDGIDWPGPADALAEMAVRNRLGLWGARLLVPLHENGHLVGMIACGVRDDGQPYDEADKARAVFLARLLRHFLGQSTQLGRLGSVYDKTRLAERYLPQTLVLDRDEQPARRVPVTVRALIGEVRRLRDTQRLRPAVGQPFRASAGLVAETGGVWVIWEEASEEIDDRARSARGERLVLLRDLALTLNHEVGNALVSVAGLRHALAQDGAAAGLAASVNADVARIERLNTNLVQLSTSTEVEAVETNLGDLLREAGEARGLRVEVPPEAILDTVLENRPAEEKEVLSVQLRATGEGALRTALISVQGRGLELEGILPGAGGDTVPNQGRLTVFMAKEIIRLHHGEVHAGPGMNGTEILISLRRW